MGGWVEGGGVGRGRGPSSESTITNVGGGRVCRGRGQLIYSTTTNVICNIYLYMCEFETFRVCLRAFGTFGHDCRLWAQILPLFRIRYSCCPT